MSNELSPPIRGSFDASVTPFLIVARSKNNNITYLLCEVEYNNIREAIFIPAFAGNITMPYVGVEKGLDYFMASMNPEGTDFVKGSDVSSMPTYEALDQPIPIQIIYPFRGILSGSNQNLYHYTDSGTLESLSAEFNKTPTMNKPYVAQVLISSDLSKQSTFTINAPKFFIDGNLLYAGYAYSLQVFGQNVFPFRNFVADLGGKRLTDYNKVYPPSSNAVYYTQNVNPTTNFLHLNATELVTALPASFYVPKFPGLSVTDPDFSKASNFNITDIEIYFIPNNYYPINFSLGTAPNGCEAINPGTNSLPFNVLNFMYFAWASGYPSPTSGISGPITVCAPGFLDSGGNKPNNLCGWTSIGECQRSYYYNYCGSGSSCGVCYGQCPTSDLPFCDINESYNRQIRVFGTPFECGSNQQSIQGINWPVIIGIVVGVMILFLIAIVAFTFTIKNKSNPRQEILNS